MADTRKAGDRVHHTRRCSRTAGTRETIRMTATGQARVVEQCRECGRTDLDARLVDALLRDELDE